MSDDFKRKLERIYGSRATGTSPLGEDLSTQRLTVQERNVLKETDTWGGVLNQVKKIRSAIEHFKHEPSTDDIDQIIALLDYLYDTWQVIGKRMKAKFELLPDEKNMVKHQSSLNNSFKLLSMNW